MRERKRGCVARSFGPVDARDWWVAQSGCAAIGSADEGGLNARLGIRDGGSRGAEPGERLVGSSRLSSVGIS